MAMTAAVKDELSRVDVPKPCCRRSEMAALLRFAGGLHIVSGRVVVEAELDTGAVARRLRREIAEVFGYSSEIHVLASGGLRKGSHYIVRIVKDGEALPARSAFSTYAAGRSVACRRASSRRTCAAPSPRGGARSWRTVR
jgi:DNA-binding protein WhiA